MLHSIPFILKTLFKRLNLNRALQFTNDKDIWLAENNIRSIQRDQNHKNLLCHRIYLKDMTSQRKLCLHLKRASLCNFIKTWSDFDAKCIWLHPKLSFLGLKGRVHHRGSSHVVFIHHRGSSHVVFIHHRGSSHVVFMWWYWVESATFQAISRLA